MLAQYRLKYMVLQLMEEEKNPTTTTDFLLCDLGQGNEPFSTALHLQTRMTVSLADGYVLRVQGDVGT